MLLLDIYGIYRVMQLSMLMAEDNGKPTICVCLCGMDMSLYTNIIIEYSTIQIYNYSMTMCT